MRVSIKYLIVIGVFIAFPLWLAACTSNRDGEPTQPEPGSVNTREGRPRAFWAAGKFTYEGRSCFFTEPGDTIPWSYPCGVVYVGLDSTVDSLDAETVVQKVSGLIEQRKALRTRLASLMIKVPRKSEQSALLKLLLLDHVRYAEITYVHGRFTGK